jgi:DNA processing protein
MKRRQLTDTERADWLRLFRTPNVGPITAFHLIERFGGATQALAGLATLTRSSTGAPIKLTPPSPQSIQKELEATSRIGARFIAACEPDYPLALAAIPGPPPVISILGNIALSARDPVAIVGGRNASAVGCKMARDIARDLGRQSSTIVSGLARGIDAEAHAASLDTGTIAVIAGGVDQIYPPQNADLYARIAERGCIVSEQPFGYIAQARDFPKRNRIISGLSLAVVVIEAAEKSGSLITARMALEQGREVMAVPGSPLDPRAKGSNRLIKQGAALIETADDVLRALSSLPPPSLFEPEGDPWQIPTGGEVPATVIAAVRQALSPTPLPIADIAAATGAPYRLVLAALAELELAGEAVTHVGGAASLAI